MSIANYFIPYAIHLTVVLVITLICFLKFQSLRKYRRKRNIALYIVLALALSLIAYKTYDEFLGPPIVTYNIVSEKPFFANQDSQFDVSIENLGMRQTNFYLVITATNASLTYAGQGGIQLNGTAIKIPISLHSVHEKVTQTVHFRMDENATGCAFYPVMERGDNLPIQSASIMRVDAVWNSRTGSYTLNPVPGPFI